ncbi:MAG TPA: DnaJ domain-containing protein [Gaiellaceae bacterium]|nr:DnaJ domain-containing protein [Gaiellaceae bacterium]
MRGEHRDPYVVLGVARRASAAEIARAYRRAARATHPDSGPGGSGEGFRAVSDAYETLRDPGRRAAYDREHPAARADDPAAPTGRHSVRYASPGSQHIVLGGRDVPPPRPSGGGRDVATLAELVLSLLRSLG